MTKLNFNGLVLNIKGEVPLEQGTDEQGNVVPVPSKTTLADVLGGLLMGLEIKGTLSIKYFGWALELSKTGILDLDDVDKDTIKELILNGDTKLTVLGRGRLMEVFKKAEATPLSVAQ